MSIIEALILGIVQGITEFLPVSSSGHLKLGELFLGIKELNKYVTFDLVCHLGTLFAIFLVFYKEIWKVLTQDRKTFWMIVIATLPLAPLYFLLSGIKALYGLPSYLGFFFLLTALFLYIGEKYSKPVPETISAKRNIFEALFIGCAQAVAILPAVSRSGSTMAAARFLGWEREKAARFSFFLAIPTILGGILVETIEIIRHKEQIADISFFVYLTGFTVSFLVGWMALKLLLKLLQHFTFKPFAYYCFIVGITTLLYVNFFYQD
ncbi:MAG: undecaprenyl-diphosphate phosphatase [Chlamydiales bacterium]|nr:undecaprenyl-diphosphate phosphatase [Chlamydiales bacterium]